LDAIRIFLKVALKKRFSFLFCCSGFVFPRCSHNCRFTPREWDYGAIPYTRPVSAELRIKNDGAADADLILLNICFCTSVDPERITVRAGEESMVTITFNPSDYSGYVRNGISIHSNVPDRNG
jgi:hypothetical protein